MTDESREGQIDATHHHSPEGRTFDFSGNTDEIEHAVELAFDYRGDVTLTLADGRAVEGYLFDRQSDPEGRLVVRLVLSEGGERVSIAARDIRRLAFTGRDTAAGKSWETWVRHYAQRLAESKSG